MASIRLNRVMNNENHGQAFGSHAKVMTSARKHSTKKSAFGELNNVLHNAECTPFKGLNKGVEGFPQLLGSSQSLCMDVLRKQQGISHLPQSQKRMGNKPKPKTTDALPIKVKKLSFLEEFDDFDIPIDTCTKTCRKPLEEIWSEMNTIDDDFLNKVINGGDADSNDDNDKENEKFSDEFLYGLEPPNAAPKAMMSPWDMLGIDSVDSVDSDPPAFHFDVPRFADDCASDDFQF